MANGQCGKGWVCEHRWKEISNMIRFRNVVKGEPLTNWWDNDRNQIGFCRGTKGMIFFNNENVVMNQQFLTCLSGGVYCDVIGGGKVGGRCAGSNVTVNANGEARIQLQRDGNMLAVHIGVC